MLKVFAQSLRTWFSFLLHASTLVHGLSPSAPTGPPLKAALITLAHERDLPALLVSIHQLEDKFNNRYQYHWIFFSTHELSEDFKFATSNATDATCIYEVIPHENWVVPGWIDSDRLLTIPSISLEVELDPNTTLMDIRRRYRWNSGIFAREKRLRDYDWFWRVEPGAQLTHDIQFDVFRFMKDNDIAVGFHRDAVTESALRILSPRVKAFIDKYPELLHEEADISWLFESNAPSNTEEREDRPSLEDDLDADSWQVEDRGNDGGDDMVSSLAEALTSWLSGIYQSSLYPAFEIGSLAFFRSPNHMLFFDHLDSAGDFYYNNFRDIPPVLPKQSILNLRKKDGRYRARHEHRPCQPMATIDPDMSASSIKMDSAGNAASISDANQIMPAWLIVWEMMARDFERQEAIPGLMSGNTVIDDRNFALV
ncbi:nucleotide-diphospho-sugar transferase [Mariannaea sp. PMI_226]|nr:nucleotide-diphospho-sugar transferase [Mariannaea sp. PMI_226]